MTPEKQKRPGGDRAPAENTSYGDVPSIADVSIRVAGGRSIPLQADYLERITLRMLQDTLAVATSGYWERRADVLEDARPRFGDFHGAASRESLSARYDRLSLQAEQCRVHATLFDHHAVDTGLLAEMLGWESVEAIAAAQSIDEDTRAAELDRFAASWRTTERAVA